MELICLICMHVACTGLENGPPAQESNMLDDYTTGAPPLL